jgi:UDP:flavonoid glycosyltransferase YjiC (YdhE family)
MNSVNESLYYGVPMVLFPQHSEQKMVCDRVSDLEAGIILNNNSIEVIKKNTLEVLNNYKYKENAIKLSQSFNSAGGSKRASDIILEIIDTYHKLYLME